MKKKECPMCLGTGFVGYWIRITCKMCKGTGRVKMKKKKPVSVKVKFVKDFGEEQAHRIELAAEKHENGINSKNKGDDPFKWALLICIGYQCMEKPSYRKDHGIVISWRRLKPWIRDNAELGTHRGDCDYLTAIVGGYNYYVEKKATKKKVTK